MNQRSNLRDRAIETITNHSVESREEEQCTRVSTMTDHTTTATPAVRGRPFAKGMVDDGLGLRTEVH
jgi:hypothetical protein